MINLYHTAGRSHDLSFAYSWNMLQSTMLKIHLIVPKFPKILARNIRILMMHEIIFAKNMDFFILIINTSNKVLPKKNIELLA